MPMLLITLGGWAQQSQNWEIIQSNDTLKNDTIIRFLFEKEDLLALRLYILELNNFKSLYKVSEQIIPILYKEVEDYKKVVDSQKVIISLRERSILDEKRKVQELNVQLGVYKNKAQAWPYWLGGGFVGGVILCLLVR